MKKYYIELVDNEDGQYVLQSKWFSTKRSAKEWVLKNLDFVDKDKCSLCVMTAKFNEKGDYDIVDSETI